MDENTPTSNISNQDSSDMFQNSCISTENRSNNGSFHIMDDNLILGCCFAGHKTRSKESTKKLKNHDEKLLHCQHCVFRTYSIDIFNDHMSLHIDDNLFIDENDSQPPNEREKNKRIRKYTGEILQCLECDYTTGRKDRLKIHLRKHTGDML